MKGKKQKNQSGMLTVEAIGSLIPFILVVMFIISLINVFAVHNKIQHALYQIGGELSAYTYFYEVLDIRDADEAFNKDVKKNTEKLVTFLDDMSKLSETMSEETSLEKIEGIGTGVKAVIKDVKAFENVQEIITQTIFFGAGRAEDKLKEFLVELMTEAMIKKYIDGSFLSSSPELEVDNYLRAYGISGGVASFDFEGSEFFPAPDHRIIDITLTYKMDIFFLKILFKDPSVKITQRVVIPAWLDGDGTAYTKE